MPRPTVDIYWGQREERLVEGEPRPVVPEGPVGIRVCSPRRTLVLFDDEPLAAVWSAVGDTAYAQVDLTNRVGFHRVAVRFGAETIGFDFETSTTKATWDDIQEMARHVARHVFAYRRQFQYSLPDGTRRKVAIPEVEFGWLRDRVPEICALVDDIAKRPGRRAHSRVVTSFQGRRVAVAQTLAHLRENPYLMEAGDGGPLVLDGTEYWPASVRVRVHQREPARQEHEQIAHFLRVLAGSCVRLKGTVPQGAKGAVLRLEQRLASARSHAVIQRYDRPRLRAPWSPVPTVLQKVDDRYGRLRSLNAEYMMSIAPGDVGDNATRANIRDAWEIYQAFCAHIVGNALGLTYVSPRCDLRDRDSGGRSMAGDTVDLYYDSRPPADTLPSWRDATPRPAAERPDIVLVDRQAGAAVVLDVKFRTDATGADANSSDLQEMQGYMNSYGLPAGCVLFPGRGATKVHSAFGLSLAELPLRPNDDHAALLEHVRNSIQPMWAIPALQ